MTERIDISCHYLKTNIKGELPKHVLVLGTGLSELFSEIDQSWDYSEIPSFSISTAPEHSGKLLIAHIKGIKVIILQGRWHYYEGYNMKEITFPIRVMQKLGVKNLLTTNIAGALNPNYKVGDFMILKDHINLFPDNPLRGKNLDSFGPRFPDMTLTYFSEYITLADKIAKKIAMPIHQGIYIGLQGPSLETPAECCFLRNIGADVVGMSTIPEVIVAKHGNMTIFAISLISNICSNNLNMLKEHKLETILKTVKKSSKKLYTFFNHFIPTIDKI